MDDFSDEAIEFIDLMRVNGVPCLMCGHPRYGHQNLEGRCTVVHLTCEPGKEAVSVDCDCPRYTAKLT